MSRLARLVVPALVAALLPSAAAAQDALYHGFTLLDPAGETVVEDAWMTVEDGRIAAVGSGPAPADAPADRHDMSGRFAIPGLIDTHVHMALGPVGGRMEEGAPVLFVTQDPEITAHAGRMLLAHGVTTVRDTGGETELTLRYARDERAGRIAGPEALVAGLIIERSEVPFEGLIAPVVSGHGVAGIVAEQAAAGVDYVKFYVHLDEADLAAGIAAAEAAGVRTIGHLDAISWTRAAELGIDSLTHMMPTHPDLLPADIRDDWTTRGGAFEFFEWWEAVDLDGPEIAAMVRTLAENQVHVDATLVAFDMAFRGDDPALIEADLHAAHPAMAENWRAAFRFDLGWQADDYRRAQAVWPKVLRLVRMLHEAGVPMSLGTDMNNPWVVPGASYLRELRLHADAGLEPWDILRLATSDGAAALGVGDRTGRLAEGMEADVVFLAADPRQDIGHVGSGVLVLDDGERVPGMAAQTP